MRDGEHRWLAPAFQVGAVLLALALTALILVATKAPPIAAFTNIALGAFGRGLRDQPGPSRVPGQPAPAPQR